LVAEPDYILDATGPEPSATMHADAPTPVWNAADKSASLRTYAEWLHGKAVETFLRDKTHVAVLFLFQNEGLVSVNAVPAGTEPPALLAGVREAVRKYALYAVISISEAWTYQPQQARDHTALQLLDGEMRVADLQAGDRSEALLVSMESREGARAAWIDPIVRGERDVTLGPGRELPGASCLKLESYFVPAT
jgi:hypothetical protein